MKGKNTGNGLLPPKRQGLPKGLEIPAPTNFAL